MLPRSFQREHFGVQLRRQRPLERTQHQLLAAHWEIHRADMRSKWQRSLRPRKGVGPAGRLSCLRRDDRPQGRCLLALTSPLGTGGSWAVARVRRLPAAMAAQFRLVMFLYRRLLRRKQVAYPIRKLRGERRHRVRTGYAKTSPQCSLDCANVPWTEPHAVWIPTVCGWLRRFQSRPYLQTTDHRFDV